MLAALGGNTTATLSSWRLHNCKLSCCMPSRLARRKQEKQRKQKREKHQMNNRKTTKSTARKTAKGQREKLEKHNESGTACKLTLSFSVYKRARRHQFLRLNFDPVLGSENDPLFSPFPTVTWSLLLCSHGACVFTRCFCYNLCLPGRPALSIMSAGQVHTRAKHEYV